MALPSRPPAREVEEKEVPAMTNEQRAVVVGVDGSDAAQGAFAHAAWEAHRRGCVLRLVYAHRVVVPYGAMVFATDPVELTRAARIGAEMLADYQVRAHEAFPELRVDWEVITDSPAGALITASTCARSTP
jgi:nucleotide-binding universal stress UspA family protein